MMIILTGNIQTGKTTAMMNWCEKRNDVAGFLTPSIEGIRMLYDLSTKSFFPFESKGQLTDDNLIKVGRFQFYKSGFKKAIEIANRDISKSKYQYFIIDEIGKLELNDSGHKKLLHELLVNPSFRAKLILMVRRSLLNELIKKFKLEEAQVIEKDELSRLI